MRGTNHDRAQNAAYVGFLMPRMPHFTCHRCGRSRHYREVRLDWSWPDGVKPTSWNAVCTVSCADGCHHATAD